MATRADTFRPSSESGNFDKRGSKAVLLCESYIGVPIAHQELAKHFLSPLRIPLKVKT